MRFSLRWLFGIPAVVGFCYLGSFGAMALLLLVSFVMFFVPKPFSVGYIVVSWAYFLIGFIFIVGISWGKQPTYNEAIVATLIPMGMFPAAMAGGLFMSWLTNRCTTVEPPRYWDD